MKKTPETEVSTATAAKGCVVLSVLLLMCLMLCAAIIGLLIRIAFLAAGH